jgi:hypothetical protein
VVRTSETVKEIAAALIKAQAAMKPATKDSENPHFKSKYADLSAVWDSIRGPLTDNGISVLQDVDNHGKGVGVTTRLQHVSGEWFEFGPLVVPMSKEDAHGVGSATTYGRRFALSAAVGVVADADDDGNAAVERDEKATRKRKETAPLLEPEAPKAPDVPVVSEEQCEAIRHAAKDAGVKTMGEFKAALLRFSGTEVASHVPADRYQHVMEQFELMKAPA